MVAWDDTGNLGGFWGWYADMGPYTGPWPPAPPVPESLPDTATEVDYVIGVLDPSSDTGFAGGGIYGHFLDVWRSWDGTPGSSTTSTDFWNPSSGAGPDPDNHLILVFYNTGSFPGSVPPVSPESLVPFLYSAEGAGFAIGDPAAGHWVTVPLANWDGSGFVSNSTKRNIAWTPENTAEFLDNCRAGDPFTSTGFFFAAYQAASAGAIFSDTNTVGFNFDTFQAGGGSDWFTEVSTSENHEVLQVVAEPPTASLPSASSFGDLPDWQANGWLAAPYTDWVEGRDYDHPPGTGLTELFVNTDDYLASYAWGAVTVTATPNSGIDGAITGSGAAVFDIRLMEDPPALPADGSSITPVPYSPDGTLLGTVTANISGTNTPASFTFTPVNGEPFSVHLRFSHFDALTNPFLTYDNGGSHAGWSAQLPEFAAPYTETVSGFRIWVPGPPVTGLRWHSVGGHFASGGGATPQILTPGVGWVDVVDGPA